MRSGSEPTGDLGVFGVKGEPKHLNDDGKADASAPSDASAEADAALAEFGARITSTQKIDATIGHGRATLPKSGGASAPYEG